MSKCYIVGNLMHWLIVITGAKGDQGMKGDPGLDGVPGIPGQRGEFPNECFKVRNTCDSLKVVSLKQPLG